MLTDSKMRSKSIRACVTAASMLTSMGLAIGAHANWLPMVYSIDDGVPVQVEFDPCFVPGGEVQAIPKGASDNPVRHADGELILQLPLSASSSGSALTHTLAYRNRYQVGTVSTGSAKPGLNGAMGSGWMLTEVPTTTRRVDRMAGVAPIVVTLNGYEDYWFEYSTSTGEFTNTMSREGVEMRTIDLGGGNNNYEIHLIRAHQADRYEFDNNMKILRHVFGSSGNVITYDYSGNDLIGYTRSFPGTDIVHRVTFTLDAGQIEVVTCTVENASAVISTLWTTAYEYDVDGNPTAAYLWHGAADETSGELDLDEAHEAYVFCYDDDDYMTHYFGPEGVRRYVVDETVSNTVGITQLKGSDEEDTVSGGDLETIVEPYSAILVEYDGDGRVTKETANTCTPCGVSGTGSLGVSYEYLKPDTSTGDLEDYVIPDQDEVAVKFVQDNNDGTRTIVFMNEMGETTLSLFETYTGSTVDSRNGTFYRYNNDGQLDQVVYNNALSLTTTTSEEDLQALADGSSTSLISTSAGLIVEYDYYPSYDHDNETNPEDGRLQYMWVLDEGSGDTDPSLTRAYTYTRFSVEDLNDIEEMVSVLPATVSIYPVEGSDETSTTKYTTTYEYNVFTDSVEVEFVRVTLPPVAVADNGSGNSSVIEGLFDDLGNLIWVRDARGVFGHAKYEDDNFPMHVTTVVSDATLSPVPTLPAGNTAWAVGDRDSTVSGIAINAETTFEYNDLGELVRRLGPVRPAILDGGPDTDDVRNATWFKRDWADQDVMSSIRVMSGYVAASVEYEVGSARIAYFDKSGDVWASLEAKPEDLDEFHDIGTTWDPAADATGLRTAIRDMGGRVLSIASYHNLPTVSSLEMLTAHLGTSGTNYALTSIEYDLNTLAPDKITSADGTIAEFDHDLFGNVEGIHLGILNDMTKVSEVEYDFTLAMSGDSPRVDTVTSSPDDLDDNTTTNDRVTTYHYDARGRRTGLLLPEDVRIEMSYDNLGRVIQAERHDATVSPPALSRRSRSSTAYDSLGRAYVTSVTGVSDTGATTNTISSYRWFDQSGNLIKAQQGGTGAAFTKLTYDGLGRAVTSFVAHDSDETQGTAYSAALDDTGDIVIQKTTVTRDDAGLVLHATLSELENGSSTQFYETYTAAWYDGAGRRVGVADYGTNVPIDWPDLPSASTDLVPLATFAYDDQGRLESIIDPMERETRRIYDDLDRVVIAIENFVNGDPDTLWDSTTNTPNARNTDENRATQYVYDDAGRMIKAIAMDPNADGNASDDQTTHYVYGTTTTESGVASGSLLRAIIYPESNDTATPSLGNGSDGIFDRTEFTYNALGEITSRKDPREVVIESAYDLLGRTVSQQVSNFGRSAEDVDDAIRQIGYSYNARGQIATVSSYDHATNTAVSNLLNQVAYEYNDFGQLLKDIQEHDDDTVASGSSPTTTYTYANGSNAVSRARLESIAYPSGNTTLDLNYEAGTNDLTGIDHAMSRPTGLEWGSGGDNIVSYAYDGLSRLIEKRIGQGVLESGATQHNAVVLDLNQTGSYDHLGRLANMRWLIDRDSSSSRSEDLFDLTMAYDRNSNKTHVMRGTEGYEEESRQFTHDDLNRIVSDLRGQIELDSNEDPEVLSSVQERDWDLDGVGNQVTERDLDNNVVRVNTINAANEITNTRVASDRAPPHVDEDFANTDSIDQVSGTVVVTGGEMRFNTVSSDIGIALMAEGRPVADHAGVVEYKINAGVADGDLFGVIYDYQDTNNFKIDAVGILFYGTYRFSYRQLLKMEDGVLEADGSASNYLLYTVGQTQEIRWSGRNAGGSVGLYSNNTTATFDDFRIEPLDLRVAMGAGWVNNSRTGSFIDESDDVLKILPGELAHRDLITVNAPGIDEFESIFSVQRSSNNDGSDAAVNFAFHALDQRNMSLLILPASSSSTDEVEGMKVTGGGETGIADSGATTLAALALGDKRWYRVTYDGTDVTVYAVDRDDSLGVPTSWGSAVFTSGVFPVPTRSSETATGFSATEAGEVQVDDFTLKTDLNAGTYDSDVIVDPFSAGTSAEQSHYTELNPEYDAAGNLVAKGAARYVYDAWNRLIRVESESFVAAEYEYDGLNRRIVRTIPGPGTLHDYYKGWSVIETRNGSGEVVRQAIWGLMYVDELIGVFGNPDPNGDDDFADVQTQGVRRWAAHDMQFNVIGLVKAIPDATIPGDADGDRLVNLLDLDIFGSNWNKYVSGGASEGDFDNSGYVDLIDLDILGSNWLQGDYHLEERYEYDIYGGRRALRSANALDHGSIPIETSQAISGDNPLAVNPFGYQGRPHDTGGLIDFRYRTMDPELGRFMQRDPMGYPDGMNSYAAYMGMRGGVDPSGTRWVIVAFIEEIFDPSISDHGGVTPGGAAVNAAEGAVANMQQNLYGAVADIAKGSPATRELIGELAGPAVTGAANAMGLATDEELQEQIDEALDASSAVAEGVAATVRDIASDIANGDLEGIGEHAQNLSVAALLAAKPGGLLTRYPVSRCNTGADAPCFVAGTLITVAQGDVAIEEIEVGDRVLTSEVGEQVSSTKVDPKTWRKITLRVIDPEDSDSEIQMEIVVLRSLDWMDVRGCEVGKAISFALGEIDFEGRVLVTDIAPCPEIESTPGRVVLATITHVSDDINLIRLINGEEIQATGNHPIFSVTAGGWVPASRLRKGDILFCRGDDIAVESVTRVAANQRVFNLEVEKDHRYLVGVNSVLVHNSCGKDIIREMDQQHILDGSRGGGGHRPGSPNIHNKPDHRNFPNSWDDDMILDAVADIATDPKSFWGSDKWGNPVASGTVDGVDINVHFYGPNSIHHGGIVSAYPTNTPLVPPASPPTPVVPPTSPPTSPATP